VTRRLGHFKLASLVVKLASLVVMLASLVAAPAMATPTQWISDMQLVPLRSGPSNGYRIVSKGLPSGTPLEVLQVDTASGYARVRTANGTEGWVETQYLVSEPVARDKLESAQHRVETLEQQLKERGKNISELTSQGQSASADRETLTQHVNELEGELADLKSISGEAIALHDRNTELTELNDRLRKQVDELVAEVQDLEDGREQRNLWIGAALIGLGLSAGALLKARPRRSGWS